MSEDNENIELRSEKFKNIIGKIPPFWIRVGTSIMFIIFIFILVGLYYFQYPSIVKGKGHVTSSTTFICYFQVTLPYKCITKIKNNQKVLIEMTGYDPAKYGMIKGKVQEVIPNPIKINGNIFFKVNISFNCKVKTTYDKIIPIYLNMPGRVKIIIGKQSLLQ